MKKYCNIEIDSHVELENGKSLGKFEESQISITNPDVNPGVPPYVYSVNVSSTSQNLYENDRNIGDAILETLLAGGMVYLYYSNTHAYSPVSGFIPAEITSAGAFIEVHSTKYTSSSGSWHPYDFFMRFCVSDKKYWELQK